MPLCVIIKTTYEGFVLGGEEYFVIGGITVSIVLLVFIIIVGLIILGGIAAIIIVSCVSANNKKHKEFVKLHSKSCKELMEINKKYTFYKVGNFNMEHSYDNVNFYDDISCEDYLIYNLNYQKKKVLDAIESASLNLTAYRKYEKEVEGIKNFGTYDVDASEYNPKKLLKYEKDLFVDSQKYPKTTLSILVKLHRVDRNDRCFETKRKWFYEKDIESIIDRLNNKSGSYYRDEEIWKSICRVERGKVSNRLRFAIYARDGYRCKKCGARDRGDNLEIDHIIPISKGGKSNPDNLQTLCWKCNKAKGNRII